MEPVIQDASNGSLDLSDITRTNTSLDTLQLKYAKIASSSSKIPIKNRQVSIPILPMDEKSLGFKAKRSHIPRIVSSPLILADVSSPPSTKKTASPFSSSRRGNESPYSTPKSNKIEKTPPSTMTKLSKKMSGLNLDSPIVSKVTPIKASTPDDRALRNNLTRDLNDTRTIAQRVAFSRSSSTSYLKAKTTKPSLKPNLSTFDENVSASLRSPIFRKPTRSIPKDSPTKRSISNNRQNMEQPSTGESSPLLARLTKSTTSSNLKANVKQLATRMTPLANRPVRPTPASSMPKSTSTRRLVSDFSRPTRSSRLKHEPCLPSLQTRLNERVVLKDFNSNLNISKKRTMTKSYTITGGMKDLTAPIATSSPRETQRIPTVPKRNPSNTQMKRSITTIIHARKDQEMSEKVSSAKELLPKLSQLPRTRELVSKWDTLPTVETTSERNPEEVIDSEPLNAYERAEITKNDKIYYLGKVASTPKIKDYNANFGFDDRDKNLIIQPGDHIRYRYQVVQRLGKGMFGDVLKCYDHKTGCFNSVKIMKNDIDWSLQSMNEIKILKNLHHDNVLRYIEHFNFRSHICVTTELLAVNMLEALEATNYHGFDINVIRKWSTQLLSGLDYIHSKGIIHADLKPENIMLRSPHSLDLKIIDFGSSCLESECMYPYIQSRFYRAPEVLMGCRYNTKIDIWSFITLIYELYKGDPLFPARDESHLFRLVVQLIGIPSSRTVLSLRNEIFAKGSVNKNNDANHTDKKSMIFTHFDRLGSYKKNLSKPLEQSNKSQLFHKRLDVENIEFSNFIKSALVWNYKDRPDATTLLSHPFLKSNCLRITAFNDYH